MRTISSTRRTSPDLTDPRLHGEGRHRDGQKSEITGYVTVGNAGPVVDPAIVEGQLNDDIAQVIA